MSTSVRRERVLPAITFPSVDQPGTKRELSFPFLPSLGRMTRADLFWAAKSEPFPTLPLALVPNRYSSLRPPLMHYGWEVNVEFLLDLADKMGCLVYDETEGKDADDKYFQKCFSTRGTDLNSDTDSTSGDDDGNEKEHDDVDKKKHDNTDKTHDDAGNKAHDDVPKSTGIHIYESIGDVVQVITHQLGIHFPRKIRIVFALKHGREAIISLYTNYDIRGKVLPEEDIRRLADRLCISEKPK